MHIAIIGNGISGITAARFLRKLGDHQITVISSESKYFFSRTALMYVYMGHMRFQDTKPYQDDFWQKNRIKLVHDHVDHIDYAKKALSLASKSMISYDKLIIACGSKPNKFGWPGQDLKRVSGLYHLQDLENMEAYSKGLNRAVIVGGGLIGIEMAEMFHSRGISVTMLVREKSYWDMVLPSEESQMINRHLREHHIDLRLSTELKEIQDDGNGEAAGVITSKGERIACGYVGLTAGVSPNIQWLKESPLELGKGILVNKNLETNMPDVYAIGDCAQQRDPSPGRRPIEAVWYTGRMQGETVAYYICDHPVAYQPGIWFNSAKFLDIEYQVYGDVLANPPAHHGSLYWEHPDGKKSIRLVYDQKDKRILGFNLMGIRYRHEVCEKWIHQKTSLEDVIIQLPLASFDPEMYKEYSDGVLTQYNQKFNQSLSMTRNRNWGQVFSFLQTS